MNAIEPLCTGPQRELPEPLCKGPLHTQWEPSAGDGLSLDPKISGELSGSFLLFFGGWYETAWYETARHLAV